MKCAIGSAPNSYGNGGESVTYGFHCVSPMEVSPHDPRVVYFRVRNSGIGRSGWGKNLTRLSPDLTLHHEGTQAATGGTIIATQGEEVYKALYTRSARSPVRRGIILDRIQ